MARKAKHGVRISAAADPAFVQALGEIAARIAATLKRADRALLPVKMFLAGGAAVHLYTGARSTGDVDAGFSKRLLPPEDLDVTYVDAKGETRLLYFDRQYTADAVHHRALEALGGYIGNSERVRGSIGLAEQLIARAAAVR